MNWYKKAKKDREYPIAAAIVAAGKVFTGRHHGEAIQKAIDEGFAVRDEDGYLEDKDGNEMIFSGAIDFFLTNKGRLISRFESSAMGEAVSSEEIPKQELHPDELLLREINKK